MEKKKNFKNIGVVATPSGRPEILLVKNRRDVKIAGLAAKNTYLCQCIARPHMSFWQERYLLCRLPCCIFPARVVYVCTPSGCPCDNEQEKLALIFYLLRHDTLGYSLQIE